ncbi:MAG: putative collagen-binding domain-containing protein [bacterium]
MGRLRALNLTLAISLLPANPHYFLAPEGKPLLLTGVYVWDIFSNPKFDYKSFFHRLKENSLNFARVWVMWGWEEENWLSPYERTGPGLAKDGRAKFNLDSFNPFFFKHLKDVLEEARREGIYLQLVVFDAWCLKNSEGHWDRHCFNGANNVNGVNADKNGDGMGLEFCSLRDEKIVAYQKRFIDKLLEVCSSYENIFFEVANENYYDREWEKELGRYIKEKEKKQKVRHLVMPLDMPNHDGAGIKTWDLKTLKEGFRKAYEKFNQPLIMDTDGIGEPSDDVIRRAFWTAFVSGGHFDFLDSALSPQTGGGALNPLRSNVYRQMGYIAQLSKKMDFWRMKPMDEIVIEGTAFVLGEKGKSYVVYLPYGGRMKLKLESPALFRYRWFNPREGVFRGEGMFKGDRVHYFTPPSDGDWAILIERK